MNYDRHDALLHYLFRQTQGDAWFRANEENVSSGVCLRVTDAAVSTPEFRVFPYEQESLEPFESAVAKLNPVVAIKVRSAAVHAALSEVSVDDACIYVDSQTRIQIIDTMLLLPTADREQCAAFIRDERVMVIWSESIDRIVPLCSDFEERLIKLLWRSRPLAPPSVTSATAANNRGSSSASANGSVNGHQSEFNSLEGFRGGAQTLRTKGIFGELGRDPLENVIVPADDSEKATKHKKHSRHVVRRTWYGRKRIVSIPASPADPGTASYDPEEEDPEKAAAAVANSVTSDWDSTGTRRPLKRPTKLLAPIYNGIAAGLALVFVGNGLRTLLMEWRLDADPTRFALLAVSPLLYCVSLFFALQIVQNLSMAIGPTAHFHSNSKYYSALKPLPNPTVDRALPHITIQMPVYKESLDAVLAPSIRSLKRAMQVYARQGGTSNVFVNDDGLRLLPPEERDKRLAFYANHNIGWVARPKHDDAPGGFKRAGRFKKASNMNYALALSLKMEKHLEQLIAAEGSSGGGTRTSIGNLSSSHTHTHTHTVGGDSPNVLNTPNTPNGNGNSNGNTTNTNTTTSTQYGIQYQNRDGDESVIWGQGGGSGHHSSSKQTSPNPGFSVIDRANARAAAGSRSGSIISSGSPALVVSGGGGGGGGATNTNTNTNTNSSTGSSPPTPNPLAHWGDADFEERALSMAIEEHYLESCSALASSSSSPSPHAPSGTSPSPSAPTPRPLRAWAANGRSCRIGEIILIVDSDTVVPEDCLRDAAREMGEDASVAIIQHESDVMEVAGHYFESGIAYFTRRVNRCISISAANGEVAPFMGHNAFLRWRALQDAASLLPPSPSAPSSSASSAGSVPSPQIWSENNVSEDFDVALRLMLKGYTIRWATYSEGGFREGVSLSADDELNRWMKYAWGCNELLFNPVVQWWRRGPIAPQIHRFLWSSAPLHYKISMMSYMFSYYGIAGSITIGVINYVLLGFQFPVDGFFMHAFEIWLATTVVFWGSGTVGYTLLEYRLGRRTLLGALWENLVWIPFFFFFFGGLAIPLTQAIFAHLFSYDMQWAATKKEVERSNFFKEIPKIVKRFWFSLLVSFVLLAGIVIVSTELVPLEWRVDGSAWAVILPLAMSCACHILYPIVLNPWLMVFSY